MLDRTIEISIKIILAGLGLLTLWFSYNLAGTIGQAVNLLSF